jgi:NADPH2:quinone reductase
MRSVVCEEFGPPSSLKEIEVPTPQPGPKQVLVRVTATGIGFVDGLLIQGLYQVKPPLPFHPASEYAGVIETVEADCAHLSIGDRVFGTACGIAEACSPTKRCWYWVPRAAWAQQRYL